MKNLPANSAHPHKSDKERYRIAQPNGTEVWVIKEAPGWRIVFRHRDLLSCAEWFFSHNISTQFVTVASEPFWPTLRAYMEGNLAAGVEFFLKKEAARV